MTERSKDVIIGTLIQSVSLETSPSSSSDDSDARLSVSSAKAKRQRKSLSWWKHQRRITLLSLSWIFISILLITLSFLLAALVKDNNNKKSQTTDITTGTTTRRPPTILRTSSPTISPAAVAVQTPAPTSSRLRASPAPTNTPMALQADTSDSSMASDQTATTESKTDCPNFTIPAPLPGKKGVGMTLREEGKSGSWIENLPKVIGLKPYWNYRWGPERIQAQPDDIEFVPMLWSGKNLAKLPEKLSTILPHIETGRVKRVLGFNEPDKAKQANMTVSEALDAWPSLESLGVPLASPSCAQPADEWMQEFMAGAASTERCNRVDWIGVHWYGGASFASFVTAMESIYHTHGLRRPLWITEFAPADWNAKTVAGNKWSSAAVLAFMKQALPWLETTDWIAGYAWFSFEQTSVQGTSSALFDQHGNMTACGRFYASVRNENPSGDQSITDE